MTYPAPAPRACARAGAAHPEHGHACGGDDARAVTTRLGAAQLMYPQADIPVTQISVQSHESASTLPDRPEPARTAIRQCTRPRIGERHAQPARDDARRQRPPAWVTAFGTWLRRDSRRRHGRTARLPRPRALRARNHPTEEHFLPLFAALVGTPGVAADAPYRHDLRVLEMDCVRI